MTQQFENFVNAALDKSLASDVTLPTANEIPVFTGIGRQVTGKTKAELGLALTADLGTAASSAIGDFDPAGSASTAQSNAESYANGLITSVYKVQGSYNPQTTGNFPTSANTVGSIPIKQAFIWIVSGVSGQYTFQGVTVNNGDTIVALIDNPSATTSADWHITESNLGYIPENQNNKDTDGTLADNSNTKYPSQKAVKTYADTKQAALVSGTNIKTVNGSSLLGSGNLVVSDENAVQRGTGNTVATTSEVVNCTSVTVVGANCVVSNSTNLNVTGDNLNIEGLRYTTAKILTFPHGSHIVGRKSTQGLYVTVSSAFQLGKADSSSVVLADFNGTKPYIGFYYYGSYSDVAYHRVTVMGTLNANNYAVFAVATRKDHSVTVTTIQAGGGYITLAAADAGAGRLTLTVSTTYSNQDNITAYVESHYGNCV